MHYFDLDLYTVFQIPVILMEVINRINHYSYVTTNVLLDMHCYGNRDSTDDMYTDDNKQIET